LIEIQRKAKETKYSFCFRKSDQEMGHFAGTVYRTREGQRL